MKWPKCLALVRHDVSDYNVLKEVKKNSTNYQRFKELAHLGKEDPEALEAANLAWKELRLGVGDHDTALANNGANAFKVGEALREEMKLPDVIFVSPYLRTMDTLKQLTNGWKELSQVRVIEDARLREQSHGLATLYNDRELFYFFNPEQRLYYDQTGRYWYQYPQGEAVNDVCDRLRSFIGTLIREWDGRKVLMVTHHLTILSIRANLERLSAEEFIRLDEKETPINCGVTLYRGEPNEGSDGKLKLSYYNKRLY